MARGKRDFDIRKICRISNGYGAFLTKEVKKLGWDENTYVMVRADIEQKTITLKEVSLE
ncbi:MAG: hypothetical protein KAR87_06650 [Candidatus Aenigmarchaeota archaeon]|nr:hypothetical protein [Candidatus Aenigmarchaeota archaeon]